MTTPESAAENSDYAMRLRRARLMLRHPRFLWWAMRNRWQGLRFDYVGRFRCCQHTTPFHYAACPNNDHPGGES